ncbi:hypothetical protein [Ruminococcus albus]|uniref:Uncharacterized protein n=1 Tax=Ruminococcus albus (strain ATCC 27210 / DSM 20455 / JCM 14654 / NCDO 2250 / 7) TaxID=697329 RepID=E6UKA5_RUMA7|nr:hypothetical protein [Ruminococcus albus]ADU24101.1 hypothetical protein Rumal_3662 [Ruminococcus albus 7 = DSM 20455]
MKTRRIMTILAAMTMVTAFGAMSASAESGIIEDLSVNELPSEDVPVEEDPAEVIPVNDDAPTDYTPTENQAIKTQILIQVQ